MTGILVAAFGYSVLGNRHMAVAIGIAPALVLSVLFVAWINRILSVKPLVYLGKISMSIYLLHFSIQCVWKIFEAYTGIEINYSSKSVWIGCVVSMLVAAALYERFGADKVKCLGSLVVRK